MRIVIKHTLITLFLLLSYVPLHEAGHVVGGYLFDGYSDYTIVFFNFPNVATTYFSGTAGVLTRAAGGVLPAITFTFIYLLIHNKLFITTKYFFIGFIFFAIGHSIVEGGHYDSSPAAYFITVLYTMVGIAIYYLTERREKFDITESN